MSTKVAVAPHDGLSVRVWQEVIRDAKEVLQSMTNFQTTLTKQMEKMTQLNSEILVYII